MSSKVKINGVNWREAQVFLASNLDEDQVKAEGLLQLLPKRAKKMGKHPGATTTELGERLRQPDKDPSMPVRPKVSKWARSDPTRLSEMDKRFLLSKVLKVAILSVFKHHSFQFNGVF